jgi:hypothetical protein
MRKLTTLLILCLVFAVILPGCVSIRDDFTKFRKEKLKLPVRVSLINLAVLDAAAFQMLRNTCEQNLKYGIMLPVQILSMLKSNENYEEAINTEGLAALPLLLNPLAPQNYAIQDNILIVDQNKYKQEEKYVVFPRKSLQEKKLLKSLSYDLDGDGQVEKYSLCDGRVTVSKDKDLLWQTPEYWWVDDFLLADANNDGNCDLSLLLWKSGSFGTQMPFWIETVDKSIKNHLFVFKLKDGVIKPLWQSSNLDFPILAAAYTDIDRDGNNEFIAVEGNYNNPHERKLTVWRWKGWGFHLVSYRH